MDWIARRPAWVGFSPRGAVPSLSVTRGSSTVTLLQGGATVAALPAASGSQAGVMTSADKAKLDSLSTTPPAPAAPAGATAMLDTPQSLAAATLPAGVGYAQTAGRRSPGDGGAALYVRVAAEPGHTLKVRSTDRLLPGGATSAANGGWWEFLPTGPINVIAAGAIGDGATDNGPALVALRDFCISKGAARHWTFHFPPGHYRYANNRWIYNLLDIRLQGYGATLQCVSTGAYVYDLSPFPRAGMFTLFGDRNGSGAGEPFVSGHRVDGVLPGATQVTLTNAADAALYPPGARILLHGFCQQVGGYAPNLRYFEWFRVLSRSGATLTLDGRVRNEFRSNWPDILYAAARTFRPGFPDELQVGDVYFGKPRIVLLDDRPQWTGTFSYAERIVLEGFRFMINPNRTTVSNAIMLFARNVEIRDLDLSSHELLHIYTQESERTLIERCDIGGLVEFDKVGEHVTLRACRVRQGAFQPHAVKAGTGYNHVEVTDCVLDGRLNAIAQRTLTVRNNVISSLDQSDLPASGPIRFYNGGDWGGEYAELSGNTLIKRPNQQSVVRDVSSFTVTAVGSANALLVTKPLDASGAMTEVPGIIEALRPGFVVLRADGITPYGTVAQVVDHDATRFRIEWVNGAALPALQAGDVLRWVNLQKVVMNGEVLWR